MTAQARSRVIPGGALSPARALLSAPAAAGLVLVGLGLLPGCERPSAGVPGAAASPAARIAVANSYLEAAVLDLLPVQEALVRLAEPGMCPGHFDLQPAQLERLRRVKLLLRFDFQSALDETVRPLLADGRVAPIQVAAGMCVPASYSEALGQVARALVTEGVVNPDVVNARKDARSCELAALAAECRASVLEAGWSGAPVVCSTHQAEFCRELGLDVRATFSGADTASIAEVNQALGSGARVRAVIANAPEGRRMADALAERLEAPVVVFGNFPVPVATGSYFDALVRENVRQLIATP